MNTHVHTDNAECDFGSCTSPAEVVTTLFWERGILAGTMEVRTMCASCAEIASTVWSTPGTTPARFTVHTPVRCTSDDPTNHQGDTCPIHEGA